MRRFLKYFLIGFISFLWLLILVGIIFSINYYRQFSVFAGIGYSEIKDYFHSAQLDSFEEFNFLILGLDQRDTSNGLLTDTIMVGFWQPQKNQSIFISLPRDLWLDHLKTKINALYYYGQEQDFVYKTGLISSELETILGVQIEHHLVVDFEGIAEIVDILSGVEIDVEWAFDDYHFPKEDGSGGVTHLRFEAGSQIMDGQRVLEYVRSRKSDDLQEGTDGARIKRQQIAFLAIIDKLSDPRFLLTNPKVLGSLYRYWQENIETDLPVSLLLNAGVSFFRQEMTLEFLSLPEEYLVNPSLKKYGLWVWEPKDNSGREIREWVKDVVSGREY